MPEHVDSTCPDDFYLSDVSPKDKPWDKHRADSDKVSGLYQCGIHQRYADRIDGCSERLEFNHFVNPETGESKLKLHMAYFCRVRYCPVCQWRRQLMWRARFFQVFPDIIRDYPDARFLFLTLTVRNCKVEELRSQLDLMNVGWKRLIQRRQFPALGCLRTTEVTRSIIGRSHPHFHAILMVNPEYFTHGYISQVKWEALWKDCLRVDYNPRIDVRVVKGKLGEVDNRDEDFFGAVCEVLKYSLKPDDLIADKEWLETITTQLKKTRSVSVSGVFKQYISEKEPEDLIGKEQEPSEESSGTSVYFKWKQKVQKYCKLPN